jgi:putative peptidoglycan lipid II flippase
MNSAEALVFFSLGLWSISGTKLVAPVFYALEDTKTPVLVGIVAFVINFAASLALMGDINVEANSAGFINQIVAWATARIGLIPLGHGGLALATSLSSMCNFFLLLFVLHRRLQGIPLREMAESFLRNFISASLMALALFSIVHQVDWTGSGIDAYSKVLVLGSLILFGCLFYLLLSYLLRSPEWQIVEQFRRSLQSRLFRG